MISYIADFTDAARDARHPAASDTTDLMSVLACAPSARGEGLDKLLRIFDEASAGAFETASGGNLAYVPSGGLFSAALGEFLARATNRYTMLSSFAPALIAMEEGILRWMAELFGLPSTGSGLFVSGTSVATLTALAAARYDRLGLHSAQGTIYVAEHTHYCVRKAAQIAGIARENVRTVPTGADFTMDTSRAEEMIKSDLDRGLQPMALVGTAGSTDTGSVDDLHALADLAARYRLWFHVDAAYGGFFQLTDRGKKKLAGIEHADSICADPHKGLFQPCGTGVLLVRDPEILRRTFSMQGDYLVDAADERPLPDYADHGVELTREFRGLRMWLPLNLHGTLAFAQELDEKLDLAQHAYRSLAAVKTIDVLSEPDLSVVAFRLRGASDQVNQKFLKEMNGTGPFALSGTTLGGVHYIRMCILSHRTHFDEVDEAVRVITEVSGRV
ncbi:aminotransferase class V-fold PLP-dependent enzyme [Streptomyces sp. RKAG293]|uniref:pyridoxal phosphate-dependent decarboxylase family protein n=1 Tax=Streptomyces sp. RKAG293 TaxID=2893403 RepID=UPI002033C0C6|nr:aminotransferase class V-fold PLP-dependent enzyme [Streptomyces sp. RKAG293]MCM2416598.1 aminotransferase class V-fold PLP-dependent enzyme [Streptomyces sp. RKAG293]